MTEQPSDVLLLSDDLIDTSRVAGAARACGIAVRSFRELDKLLAEARTGRPAAVVVDLHHGGLDMPFLLKAMTTIEPRPRVVGYGSHVDAGRLKAARSAGCDAVMPRSQFFGQLEQRLRDWLGLSNEAGGAVT